jgi:isopenicillin-N epimerase
MPQYLSHRRRLCDKFGKNGGNDTQMADYVQWIGTRDPAAALAVPAAIDFMEKHHWHQVRQQCHILLRQAIERICALTRLPPAYPLDSNLYAQMGIAPLTLVADLAKLKNLLYDEYRIEIPLIQWKEQQFARISVQGYNTQEDIDALVKALEALLPQ